MNCFNNLLIKSISIFGMRTMREYKSSSFSHNSTILTEIYCNTFKIKSEGKRLMLPMLHNNASKLDYK